ncbi:MAG: helix-turn-helix domain-containing protein [Sciscionella sp.]
MYKFSGERLSQAALKSGLRNEHLALATDRSTRAIEFYRSGKREPNLSTGYALARALGVDVADLLEEVANVA